MIADEKKSLDITVLMGGPSSEREISLITGKAISDGLIHAGHKVTQADINPNDTTALDRKDADLFFIALHGEFGESGEVQQLCENRGLKYTGSDPKASQLGMDKAASKQIFKRAGLSTADFIIVEQYNPADKTRAQLESFPLPCVAKPVAAGSSVDVFLCKTREELTRAADLLLDTYDRAMIEKFVAGREVTVGILGCEPLPLIEIRPDRTFYDHDAKYADTSETKFVFDHGIAPEIVEVCQEQALVAYHALGCRDLGRVDFIIDEHNVPQVLEINTIPGFTSHSLVPKAAAKVGISFPALVDKIARYALRR